MAAPTAPIIISGGTSLGEFLDQLNQLRADELLGEVCQEHRIHNTPELRETMEYLVLMWILRDQQVRRDGDPRQASIKDIVDHHGQKFLRVGYDNGQDEMIHWEDALRLNLCPAQEPDENHEHKYEEDSEDDSEDEDHNHEYEDLSEGGESEDYESEYESEDYESEDYESEVEEDFMELS